MTVPYVPTPFSSPIVNPAVGSTGAPPLPHISNAEFLAAPTAVNAGDLNPGNNQQQQAQTLADTIRRASRWADTICFGADAATKGASLAASLTIDSATIRIKAGTLRLICDYRPLVELVGVAVGSGMADLAPLDSSLASLIRVGRRTFYVPFAGPLAVNRTSDSPAILPGSMMAGSVYAVWSYVNGYPHMSLAESVDADATSCVVNSTDGNGGVWGVFASSSPFPGTQLTVVDGANTESVFVQAIETNTPTTGQTTLTTSAFANSHTVPDAPDFIPVTAIPEDVHQAVISLTTMLIKTRGIRGMVMPSAPGGRPTQQAREKLGQAGALEDFEIAHKLLSDGGYVVRVKHAGSY